MSKSKPKQIDFPFGLSRQQIERLQRILDCNGAQPAEFADEWGVSVDAADKDVARMRKKVGARSMSELLTKVLRTGAIIIPNEGAQPRAAENVHSGVLDTPQLLPYNVPDLVRMRILRESLAGQSEAEMGELSAEPNNGNGRDLRRLDDAGWLADCVKRTERNNRIATSIGLPAVGSGMLNKYGIEWVVDGHVHVATQDSVSRWRKGNGNQPQDLYPSIIPQNLSDRFNNFIAAVDRCTSKTFILLDTTPGLRRGAVPGSNWLDTASNEGTNLVFLDATRVHETVLAHEIGHAWVQYVDECEDERVMRDTDNIPRLHQFNFVQSFVLDLKVNEVIQRKGFDMTPIVEDQVAAVLSLCAALQVGYRPPTKREEVFVALTVASALIERSITTKNAGAVLTRTRTERAPLFDLALAFADAVKLYGYADKGSVRRCIDECLTLAFQHTQDAIDLDRDLVSLSDEEPQLDKYPSWIAGATVRMKCEIGRIMAREDIPEKSRWRLEAAANEKTRLKFEMPDGQTIGDWLLDYRYPFSDEHSVLNIMEINRRNRMRISAQSNPGLIPPVPGNSVAPLPYHRRHYMSGLGRFLTQARLQEQLRGEHPYAYAMNNPLRYVDPSGRIPASGGGCGCTVNGDSAFAYLGCVVEPPDPCKSTWNGMIDDLKKVGSGPGGNNRYCKAIAKAIQALCKKQCLVRICNMSKAVCCSVLEELQSDHCDDEMGGLDGKCKKQIQDASAGCSGKPSLPPTDGKIK